MRAAVDADERDPFKRSYQGNEALKKQSYHCFFVLKSFRMRLPAVIVVAALLIYRAAFSAGDEFARTVANNVSPPGEASGGDALDSRRRILNGRSGKRRGQLRDANGLQ